MVFSRFPSATDSDHSESFPSDPRNPENGSDSTLRPFFHGDDEALARRHLTRRRARLIVVPVATVLPGRTEVKTSTNPNNGFHICEGSNQRPISAQGHSKRLRTNFAIGEVCSQSLPVPDRPRPGQASGCPAPVLGAKCASMHQGHLALRVSDPQ